MAQARLHQGKGDPGIDGFAPAKTQALHQHPGHLGHIGVGIGIGGAPAHHHQQGFVDRHGGPLGGANLARGRCGSPKARVGPGHPWAGAIGGDEGLANPGPGCLDHLEVNPQFPAVIDPQAGFGGIGIENGGDVVFGVASGKQHGRHGQHPLHPLGPQAVEPLAQDRPGKFQVAVGHGHLGHQLAQGFSQLGKFGHGQAIAAAMAADQHAEGAAFGSEGGRASRGMAGILGCCARNHGMSCLGSTLSPASKTPRRRAPLLPGQGRRRLGAGGPRARHPASSKPASSPAPKPRLPPRSTRNSCHRWTWSTAAPPGWVS